MEKSINGQREFGFVGGADWICDAYVNGLEEITDMYLNAVYKD